MNEKRYPEVIEKCLRALIEIQNTEIIGEHLPTIT